MKRFLLFITLLGFLLAACSPAPTTPLPTPTQDVQFYGVLVCENCTGIFLWQTPSRFEVLATYSSGTPCKVLNITIHEGQRFYKVDVNGLIGWVEYELVQQAEE